ncbi:MAG TPA: AMP-binding protein [Vicinamibacterales bacterium]|nr:AMP-binding protein [Vicinamibacterales bacterium]
MSTAGAADAFFAARDFLLKYRTDYDTAVRAFQWPARQHFNWALDYFDTIASGNDRPALHIVDEDGAETIRSFAELSAASNRVANFLRDLGARAGDCLLLMLGNQVELWETLLAAIKLGVVVTPATTLLTTADLQDRVDRGRVRHVVTGAESVSKLEQVSGAFSRIAVGDATPGWHRYEASRHADAAFSASKVTRAGDPMLLYFTSGTTAKPKLVVHTHQSYPVGHLSTLYWIGLRTADRHWNISSPGWAKHAWSSFFAPWNAEAMVFIFNYARFNTTTVLDALVRHRVTSLCAPPTVWRMLVQQPLSDYPVVLREVVSAGEPLNPEVIGQVQKAWGLTIRDGYGQTETTAQIGNSPGQPVKPGSMGRPLPGYDVVLVDPEGQVSATDGEICLRLDERPLGLTSGYADDDSKTADVMRDGYYHTGDIASRDRDGYLTFVGRVDDVFKASDYRLSPFELESVLIEHAAVAEAAVVPSPDPLRHAVPKAFVTLAAGFSASRELAADILSHCRSRLAPYKRIRRIEFAALPKTISGKIRRIELRQLEMDQRAGGRRGPHEFFEEDL